MFYNMVVVLVVIVIREYSRCRGFFYLVGRDDRGDNENENYEKHACSNDDIA